MLAPKSATAPSFAEIAVSLSVQANYQADRTTDAEVIAARIGLTKITADRIITERRFDALCTAEAHRVIKALIPFERVIVELIRRREARDV